ncbi:MAG: hypothetical protein ACI8P3_003940 [Saprospiraceae bacterium]|jgi:hypothetical protein
MKYLSIFIVTIFFLSCGNTGGPSADLTLIPKDKIIERMRAGNFDYRYATFKTQKSAKLNEQEQKMLNDGKFGKDYYEDANGVIKEIIIRPIEMEDKFIEIQRRELAANPMKGIQIIDIDCDSVDAVYKEIYRTDQEARKNRQGIKETDTRNLQLVVSAISKCGWSEANTQTIWLIFQHSPLGVMAYYYPDVKAFSEKGNLSRSSFAMLQDRLLTEHGYKQLYGTQILSGELYKLEDPDGVNARRKEIGMGVIEDYIGAWGLDLEAEKERWRKEEEGE